MEHRRNQRFDLKLPFELMASENRMGAVGETKDVSSCGVRFESPVTIEIGEPIEYYLKFPRMSGSRMDVRVHCMGKVVRSAGETTFGATIERYEFVRNKT
jgi:PilZ domain